MIAVERGTPIRSDTVVSIETQGLTGGAAVALKGGTSSSPVVSGEDGAPPTLIAEPQAGPGLDPGGARRLPACR